MTKGERIRAAREEKGITQEELGRMCGTTKQTIFKYESGTVTNIPLVRLEKLAEVLDVTPCFIMGWDNPLNRVGTETSLIDELEHNLIYKFHSLNTEGQEKLLDYADDLVQSGKYIKSDSAELGAAEG